MSTTDLTKPGQKYQNFELKKIIHISELQCVLRELEHLPSGAQVMHIENDDPENLFCLSFQTLPENSNGVAHILEHTVLCGSQKFPIKDPFFAMTRRSLNTFMNALTGSDFTCYPAATQISKDFYNLLEVYLDAVFRPNLNEFSFMQEGHRLEFSIPSDSKSPLAYKGIVFNEMKGAMASPSARLIETLNSALFPDLTYGFNSGGDPTDIPQLTYQELLDFHKKHYHPSRCLFFFYGNLPLKDHLDFIAKDTLDKTAKKPSLSAMPVQKRFLQPKYLTGSYPISNDQDIDDKSMIAFAWLTSSILNQEEILALSVLEIVLMETDASPLKLAFLKSGLCKQASIYIEPDTTETPLIITLKGCLSENADQLENIMKATLTEIVEKGISAKSVENALHRLEFYRSEITGDHHPFGLSLFMRSALLKQHGANPEDGLMIHSLFKKLHTKIEQDPKYLTNLIQKYMLDNTHFVRLIMNPDPLLGEKELAEEEAKLSKIQETLSEEKKERLIKHAQELADFQKSQEEEDIDVLPEVTLADVPKDSRNYPLTIEKHGHLTTYHHATFTNEIVYADLVFNLPKLEEEDLFYVRLFSSLLTQVGCGNKNYIDTLDYIQAYTGGIGASMNFNMQVDDFNQFYPSFSIRGKALYRNAEKLFLLIKELITSCDFSDINRLKEIVLKNYSALQSSFNQNALKYAINLSASRLNVVDKITNDWYGLNYYTKLQELARNFDEEAKHLVIRLQDIQKKLFSFQNADLVLSCDATFYKKLKTQHFYGLKDLPQGTFIPWESHYSLPQVPPQGIVIASPIAFIGKVFQTIPYIHPDAPALSLAAHLFDNIVLHKRLREQGGAYGGGASCSTSSGTFYFYTYRDPNIASSLEAFTAAIKEIASGNFDESDIEEAQLEMIQALDSPVSPGSLADVAYGWLRQGKTPEIRQAFRDSILALTKDKVIEAVKNHVESKLETGATVVFASKELLEKENAVLLKQGKDPLRLVHFQI